MIRRKRVTLSFATHQALLAPSCGSDAYFDADKGQDDCPFSGDGITGVNHNAVYHFFEIASKLVLCVALRFMVVDGGEEPKTLELHGVAEAAA